MEQIGLLGWSQRLVAIKLKCRQLATIMLNNSDTFPFKWINKKWRDGFYVTSMASTGNKWVVVMSHDTGFSKQVVELDFLYPCDSIVNLTLMQTIFLSGNKLSCPIPAACIP